MITTPPKAAKQKPPSWMEKEVESDGAVAIKE
jgi:hypothetical protein